MSETALRIAGLTAAEKKALAQELLRKKAQKSRSFPVSFGQRRLWFLDRLDPGNPAYNMPLAVRLAGGLDAAAFRQGVAEIIRRHDVLRTSFQVLNGEPVQVVAADQRLKLPLIDLLALPTEVKEIEARRLAGEEAGYRFDLEKGCLRVLLVHLAADDHLVLANLHHVICDEWSRGLFIEELSVLYAAFIAGQSSPLEPLPLQYADFATWQRSWMQGEVLERHLAFWRQRLSGVPLVLDLPTDHPRPPVPSRRGAVRFLSLPADLSRQLRQRSREHGTTLFMTLLAAFQLLLGRYSGQRQVTVGTPVAGRTRLAVEKLLGFFVNTLVLAGDFSDDPTLAGVLARVRDATLGAFEHQDMPFEKLVEELQPERDLARPPLFQVMFALQNLAARSSGMPGLSVVPFGAAGKSSKFDLTLFMNEDGPGIEAALEYDAALFDAPTMERLLGHFRRLLKALAVDPGERAGDVPLLDAGERRQVLAEWNDTAEPWAETICLHELIAGQAARTPEATAVVYAGEALTYGELDRRANRVAHALRRLGVGPEVLVGVLLKRSLEVPVALLAVLKAGGAYVPMDPDYPRERLEYMLRDSGVPALLVQPGLRDRLPELAGVTCLDPADCEAFAGELDTAPESGVSPANLAYVIYTSGSTGRPKGVAIPHSGVLNYLSWCMPAYGAAEGTGTLVHSSLSFDLTVTSLFAPLAAGRPCELLPQEEGVDALGRAMQRRSDLSLLKLTPSHLEMLAHQLDRSGMAGRSRAFVIGGESLPVSTIDQWRQAAPETRLINEYGPTETVVGCCVYEVPLDRSLGTSVPIGRPIGNTRLYVLDGGLSPVPIGVTGELYVGGVGVGRGYLNRPGLTAEKFVPDPWGDEPGLRLYRTGDRVRHLPSGLLDFLGRADDQVKIRGFRIEPGEIEAVLAGDPAVEQAIVMARPEPTGAPRLVAYVVLRDNAKASAADLRERASRSLPGYMVPSVLMILPDMPLTVHGKVDRSLLPVPTAEGGRSGRLRVAPRTAEEAILSGLWREVLLLDAVDIHESFFELGGDSILAVQLISRANRAGLQLTLPQLFQHQTIAELAAVAEKGANPAPATAATGSAFSLSGLSPEELERFLAAEPEVEQLYPVSPIQEAMLAYALSLPGSEVGFEQVSCNLRGDLDRAAFRRAWDWVLRQHPVLRTSFLWEGLTRPLQAVHGGVELPLVEEDWRGIPAEETRDRLAEFLAADRRRGFDLHQAPLMRLALLTLADDLHTVVWSNHHILMDGWCRSLVLGEVLSAYEAFRLGGEPRSEDRRPYRDYIEWLERRDAGRAELFWRSALKGFREPARLRLPAPAAARAEGPEEIYARQGLWIPAGATARLQAMARRHRLTLNTLVKGAWALLLSRYTGTRDVVFGTIFSGRPTDLAGAEAIVGLFMNILPVRVALPLGEPAAGWLERLQREQAEYHNYEFTPLDQILGWSEVPPGRHLFDTLLVVENYPVDASAWEQAGTLEVTQVEAAAKTNFELTLMVVPGREIAATLIYGVRRQEAATMERMVRSLETLLNALADDPGRLVGDLPIESGEQALQVLYLPEAFGHKVPVGPPFRILDGELRPVPPRVPGVLWSLDRTGIVARSGYDGWIEPLGRAEDRVWMDGFGWIDLWEIEAALRGLPAVGAAAVQPLSQQGGIRLVACVVPAGKLAPAAVLREQLRPMLPAAMLPASFVILDALPWTADGWVDRAALEALAAQAEDEIVRPRNVLESKLVRLWEDILDRRPIGVTEDFFTMGGNSLLALRVMARMRDEFGRDLPLSIFFRGSTIEDLALILRDETGYRSSPLVAIQPRGERRPLICVHPIGGSVIRYMGLVPFLAGRPLYALEARNRDQPPPSLEAVAAEYLDAMAAANLEPPYLLAGWSFGGLVAFEMARQLEERGVDTALVALLDTLAPFPEAAADAQYLLDPDDPRQLLQLLEASTGRDLPIRLEELEGLPPETQKEIIFSEAKRLRAIPRELHLTEALRDLKSFMARGRLSAAYRPRSPYAGRVVLFRCRETDPDLSEQELALLTSSAEMGWERFTSRPVEVIPISGRHATLLDPPNVEPLARLLTERILRLESGDSRL